MNDNQFTIVLENGSEQVCDFLFKFHDEDSNKNYIFFQIIISGVCDVVEFFEDETGEIQLNPVKDEKERQMLNEVLEEFNNSHQCGCGGGCGCSDDDGCGDNCACSAEEETETHTCCGGCGCSK